MKVLRKLQLCMGAFALISSMGATLAFGATPTFTFSGDGYSHGVGMSQMGTLARANNGESTETILKAYFKGTSLTTLSGLSDRYVRIALDKDSAARSSWKVRPGNIGASFVLNSTTQTYGDTIYTFKVESGSICMYKGATKVRTISGTAVNLVPSSGSTKLMEVYDSSGPFSYTHVRYRGYLRLEISGTNLKLYNYVPVQEYLYGVVPRELGASYYSAKPAASRVQAICARSYGYANIMKGSTLKCTTASQVYGGYGRWSSAARTGSYAHEEAQSNQAVNDTKNQCVTYNGTVITTYFGSCNGSITANIEDVWGGSAKPYYVGVTDPTHPSKCSHSWTVTTDGMKLAATLKSKGASVPSGAGSTVYVASLSPTYGHNGWVKSMTIVWSNGATTTISYGDSVRVRFGLRSARFKVATSGTNSEIPTGAKLTRVEESNKSIRRYGSWTTDSATGTSGGKHTFSKTNGNYVMVKFKGEGVSWVGSKGSTYGRAKVYVDGAYKQTVDLKSSTTKRQQRLYTISGLTGSSVHTFKIVVTTKSGSTSAGTVDFDAADIINGTPQSYLSHYYEETSSLISHSKFSTISNSGFSGGKAYRTIVTGKYAKFNVRAQNFEVYSKTSPKGGRFKVYVNGGYVTTVNLRSTSTKYGVKVYSRSLNPSKEHTIKLVSTTASGSKSAGEVVLDRVLTYDGVLVN